MSRLTTIRRLLMRVAGVALVLSGLTLYVVHTSPVRRFALGRIQALLSRTQGLTLDVGDFDYNLLSSKFELKRVALRGVPLADMPAPLTAERALISIPVWRLIGGSLEAAQVRIDGLRVHWITATSGRSNWPSMSGLKSGGISGGPTISVTSGEINVQDSRNGFTLRLPNGRLSTAWNPAAKEYSIAFDSSGGQLQWNEAHLAVDKLQLTSAAASSGFSVASLQLVSGKSWAEVSGLLAGAPPQIDARGTFDIEVRHLSRALGLAVPAEGRVQGAVSASGPVNALQLKAQLQGDGIAIRGTPIGGAAAEGILNTATRDLQIRSISASVFSGRLTGNATISAGDNPRPSNFAARIAGVDPRQIARAFGSAIPSLGRASVEVRGAWPGLNWRRATIAGVAQSAAATVNFKAAGNPNAVRVSLDGRLRDGSTANGDIALRLQDHALTGKLIGFVPSLARLSGELERLLDHPSCAPVADGGAHLSATLRGTLGHPAASVQAAVDGLSIGAGKGADVRVDADFDGDRIEIRRGRFEWGGQDIDLQGQIGGLSANASLQLEGTVEGRSLAPMMEQFGFAGVAEAAVSGTVRISGSVGQPAVETTLSLDGLTAWGERFAQATLDARWQNTELTVSRFQADQHAESGAPGRIDVSGSLDIGAGRYAFDLAAQNLRPNTTTSHGGVGVAGTFQVESHGAGTLQDPVFSARVDGSDVWVAGVFVGELRGEVEAKEHRATVLAAAPALNARATSTVAMEGDWLFDLMLQAEKTRLNTTPAVSFDANVRGAGSLADPRLERVAASIRNLRAEFGGQEIAGDGPLEVSYADGRLQVERLALKSGESKLTVRGAMPLDGRGTPGALSLEGRVVLDPFSSLLPGVEASKTGGAAEVSVRLIGNGQQWAPEGAITIRDSRFHLLSSPLGVENVSGRLDVANGILRADNISGKVGTGTLRIDGSLPLRLLSDVFPNPAKDAGQPARFAARLDDLRLSGGKGEHAATATFSLKTVGETSAFNADALRATVEFSELGIDAGASGLRQTAPTRITVSGGMARLENLDAKGPGSSLKASGSIGLSGEHLLQTDVAGEADLAVLAALAAPLEAAGRMRVEAHVEGTLTKPRTTGFVALEQATFASSEPRFEAKGVKLNATLAEDQVKIGELSGSLNGGTFWGGGDLKLQGWNIVGSNLSISSKDTFLEYPAGVKTTSSLQLKLLARENRLILEGQIEIEEGYYDSPLEVFGSGQGLNHQMRVGTSAAAGSGLALNLRILTKRPVEMDNNLGRLAGTADLRLAGSVNQPRLLGTLELEEDGRLYFGDRTYYIERGTIRFLDAPKLTPELNLRAYTRVGDYTVHLGLSGELKEVTTTFTSDPPLSRDDVIAVLLTGKTVAENRGVDLQALEAYALATGAVNASLSSRLHRTLGVSRVSIQPSAVAAESNPGARITITQDFTRTLRMMYSMNLSDSNDQIWVSEYDLSRRFTTRAVKESDNTYRGEFRHDIRFGSSSTKESAAARIPMPKISKVEYTGSGPFSPSDLGKRFKVKPGQNANPMRMRKGAEKLTKFLTKEAYLESRVHVDRVYGGTNLSLTVRIELGPKVEMAYQGAELPRRQRARVRSIWHAGISNQQRREAAKDALLNYFADKGYLRAQVTPEVLLKGDHKLVQFDLRPGTRYRGVKIEIERPGTARAQDILALLQQRDLRLSVYRDFRRASEAIARFYEQRGYLAARTAVPVRRLDAERRTGRIVIPVNEGPVFRVGALRFSGNSALTAENLSAGLPLEAGAIFEPARLEPTSAALKLKYGKLGYGEADIDYEIEQHDDRASVDVSFTIVENKQTSIGEVKVEGNRHTSPDFARGQLRVASGEIANTALIRESAKNLAQTGAYASADIRLQPPIESGASDKRLQVADLTVAVAEPKPFRLLYGGLYDSGGGPGFIADFQNHNSLGAGRILGLRTRVDPETDEVRLYVTRPFWRQHRLSTTIGTYFTRETEHDQTTPTEKLGVSIQQDLPLRSKWLLSYGYRFEKQRGFVPDPAAPDIQTNVALVAPVTFTISRDARDSFLDATRGSFVSHGFELAPGFLGSDYPYARYYVQYFKYFPLTRPRPVPFGEKPLRSRLVFASGSRLGLQKGFNAEGAALTDRFYAGGGTTVRGFKQDELGPKLSNGQPAGGNAVLVLNEELRYPLFWVFDAVTFVDVGNVFPRISDFKISELRTAAGFGLRIRNPFVVLRLDYGFKFDRRPGEKRGAFFFSIGQAF